MMLHYTRILAIWLAAVAAVAGTALQYAAYPAVTGAGGKPRHAAGEAASGAAQQTCVDDVSISNVLLTDEGNGYVLLDPPDYATDSGARIAIYYDAVNHSCQDVTAKVKMRGSVSNAVIDNDDAANDVCTDECTIAAGDTHYGNFLWDLSGHPATNGEAVVVTITITAPTGFSDTNAIDNSVTSTDTINILAAAPEPTPTPTPTPTPEPVTDIAVTAVTVASTVIIGEKADVEVMVANQGNTTAANVSLSLYIKDSTESAATGTAASIAKEQSATVSLAWNTAGNAPGTYPLRVVARVDGDNNSDNNSGTASVVLRKPQVDVGFTGSISAPQVAILGSTITLKATIANRGETAIAAPLGLYIGGASAAATSVTTEKIEPNGSLTASIDWDTSPYSNPRDYQLQLKVAVPDDASADDNTLSTTVDLFLSAFDPSDDDTPDSCTDDVRVNVSSITDNNYPLLSPPDYKTKEEDTLLIAYEVYNYSCESDVTAVVKLTGTATGIAIDGDEDALCIGGCRIPAGGRIETTSYWYLSEYRAVSGEKIKAVVETTQPADFTDANQDNNTYISQQGINVSYPDDIVLDIGLSDANRGKIGAGLERADLGQVKVRLVSARASATISYYATSVPLHITVANDGEGDEFAVAMVSAASSGNRDAEPLLREALSIPAMQSQDFTMSLPVTKLRVGRHAVAVQIFAVNNLSSDNTATLYITRKPEPVDLEILSITTNPDQSAMQGEWVEIQVAVRNNSGRSMHIPVQLTFPSAAKRPEIKSPWVQAGATGVATFTWKTRNYAPAVYTLRARILATDNVTAGDSSRTLQFRIAPLALAATIVDIETNPVSAVVGEAITITVSVRNDGPIFGSVPVTLHFPSAGREPETRRPRIELGEVGTAVFVWQTDRYSPGAHTFRIQASEEAFHSFTINLLEPVADFAVTEIYRSDPDPSRPVVKGDWVGITAKVVNNGPYAGRSVLTLRDLAEQRDIGREAINLGKEQSGEVTFTWKTRRFAVGEHRLQVVSDADYDIHPGNDGSNEMPVIILNDRDISIEFGSNASSQTLAGALARPDVDTAPHIVRYVIEDVTVTPAKPVVSYPVQVTVTVRNAGTHSANVPVTLHFPADDKQPETRRPRIAPGQTANAAFVWRTGRYHYGAHTLRAEVPTAEPKAFTVNLHSPTVDFKAVELYPVSPGYPIVKGDWVEVAAFVRNVGPHSGRGRVVLRDLTERRAMYSTSITLAPDGTRIVEFLWKTLRYAVGEHRLQVSVEASHDDNANNDYSNVVAVTILTNRDIIIRPGGGGGGGGG